MELQAGVRSRYANPKRWVPVVDHLAAAHARWALICARESAQNIDHVIHALSFLDALETCPC